MEVWNGSFRGIKKVMQILSQVSLKEYTSWLIGGCAEFFCSPENILELKQALQFAEGKNLNTTVIGGGSNVLISDHGIRGLVISMRKMTGIKILNEDKRLEIEVSSGTGKSELLKIFLKYKLPPALFLAGLPGDVGGGIAMNAGVAEAFVPREFCELIEWIEVLKPNSLQVVRYQKSELQWSYRHSQGWQPGIIIAAGLSWENVPDDTILEKVRNANKNRLSKQPLQLPSCGSVFKNPNGHKAAQLIDSCGLKGFTVGGAQVSMKHANFIVNLGEAKATDVDAVIKHVQKVVFEKTQVGLITEVIRLGEW